MAHENPTLFERFQESVPDTGTPDYARMAFEYAYNLGRRHEQYDSRGDEPVLKPCPFCGVSNLRAGHRNGGGYVDCRNCHTVCEFYHGNSLIARWNNRTPPATDVTSNQPESWIGKEGE